jgi:hypothetical protein
MSKEIAKIEGKGIGNNLIISIMDNGNLHIGAERWSQAGPIVNSIFIEREQAHLVLDAIREYFKRTNLTEPLW